MICLHDELCNFSNFSDKGVFFSARRRFPRWPYDFRWSNAGAVRGYRCVQIKEPASKYTWHDNYFCSRRNTRNPGMRWSFAGPIRGMRCTQIKEPADSHIWKDNYLCVPRRSRLRFKWSFAGRIRGMACIQWREPADPHTWHDNFLCGKLKYKTCSVFFVILLRREFFTISFVLHIHLHR